MFSVHVCIQIVEFEHVHLCVYKHAGNRVGCVFTVFKTAASSERRTCQADWWWHRHQKKRKNMYLIPRSMCTHTYTHTRTHTHTHRPQTHDHCTTPNFTFSHKQQAMQVFKAHTCTFNKHAHLNTWLLTCTQTHPQSLSKLVTVGLQIKQVFSFAVTVVLRVSRLSHGAARGGIQSNMIMLGEACLGGEPGPCALLQIWNMAKCCLHDSSN